MWYIQKNVNMSNVIKMSFKGHNLKMKRASIVKQYRTSKKKNVFQHLKTVFLLAESLRSLVTVQQQEISAAAHSSERLSVSVSFFHEHTAKSS